MADDIECELERWKKIAEEHAFSVRQLTAQRARLFEVFKLVGRVAAFNDEFHSLALSDAIRSVVRKPRRPEESRLFKVLQAIEDCQSQFMQDIICLLFAFGKTNGFFVEFGACDGILISNTVLLERQFGWQGVLSEPAPSWHERLRNNRKCAIDTRCVWSTSGRKLLFGELANDEYFTQSGVIATGFSDNIAKQYEVDTISLIDLIREHKAPTHIDMLSVDTEGSEFAILESFPFNEYTFGFICVEHHQKEQEIPIKSLLEAAGYKQVFRSISGHDGFYVPASNSFV
jgi:FkbM family methyltransferase